jgi:RHS repeat-associated protein
MLNPYAGGSVGITGAITDSSGKQISWILTMLDRTYTGIGTQVNAAWDGKYTDGTVVEEGEYSATLTAQTSDGRCKDSKTVNFTVTKAEDGQCGLYVTFGSSAHMASGNLSHSQELFSSRSGALPAGITLYYNSLDPHNGSLGRGWSHSYDISLKENINGSTLVSEGNWQHKRYSLANGVYVGQPGNYSTLAKNTDGTFRLTSKDGQISIFSGDGKLASITDRNGNTANLAYIDGNLATVTDPDGRVVSFSYDNANHLTSVNDPSGNTYVFTYNGNTLASVSYPDGGTWRYTYDANAFMLTKTDPLGNTTTYTYDANHRAATATDPEGKVRSVSYPQPGTDTTKTTTFTEKDGGVWTYRYDTQAGTLTSKTDPQGGITSYTYDAAGNRTATTLPDGSTTTSTYDVNGNMTSTTDALGQTTSYTYNSFGQVLSITDPLGSATRYSYDATGNMNTMTDTMGATTQYQYDAKGNVSNITNPLGQTTSFVYDAAGNLASVTDTAGVTTGYSYDAAGNLSSRTDASGAITRYEYNAKSQVIKVTDPQGNATTYTYDLSGNKTSQTDANGNTTKYDYNYKGQLIKTIDALGNGTSYTYSGTGCASCGGGTDKITALTDANGNSTGYRYDLAGKLVNETDPLGNTTGYGYDAKGTLTSKTDGNGNTIKYTYDGSGRLLKKIYPDGTEETYTYDVKGNILTATNQNIGYTFTYDAAGRVTKVTDTPGKAISYAYDAAGNKTKTVTPDGRTITYSYEKGRLTGILDGGAFTFGYDSLGRRSSLAYPNGDTTTYVYDKDGSLTTLLHRDKKGAVIASNNYILDKIGNRLSNTTQDRGISYTYDAIYRLNEALSSAPGYSTNSTGKGGGIPNANQQQKEFYTYDPVGNRLSSHKTSTYVYNQGNQLLINGGTYSYDRNGNLTQKITPGGTTTFGWDYENRLIKVTTPAATAEYMYDPLGRRIGKTVTDNGTTTTTHYVYDADNILFEYDDTGAIGNRYTHGPGMDEHLMINTGKDKYYYHADGLGSIVALTDAAGNSVQAYEYDSFGNLKDQKNRVKQPYTYTGREWDKETGLYYYRARYYDPMEGRFISKDPSGFAGGDANLYGYVKQNSINMVDPTGKVGAVPIIVGGAVVATGWLYVTNENFRNWANYMIGVMMTELGEKTGAGIVADKDNFTSFVVAGVAKYNALILSDGCDSQIDPVWAQQHPFEAWGMLSFATKENACCK